MSTPSSRCSPRWLFLLRFIWLRTTCRTWAFLRMRLCPRLRPRTESVPAAASAPAPAAELGLGTAREWVQEAAAELEAAYIKSAVGFLLRKRFRRPIRNIQKKLATLRHREHAFCG